MDIIQKLMSDVESDKSEKVLKKLIIDEFKRGGSDWLYHLELIDLAKHYRMFTLANKMTREFKLIYGA